MDDINFNMDNSYEGQSPVEDYSGSQDQDNFPG